MPQERKGLTRREVLRVAALGTAALALGELPADATEAVRRALGDESAQLVLRGYDTAVTLSREHGGIEKLVAPEGAEIPFLIPALTAEHFYTGAWPRPQNIVDYEPLSSAITWPRHTETEAEWRQYETPYSHLDTRVAYRLAGPGEVEAAITTRSRATAYPYGYVGTFCATMPTFGGQRGFHLLVPDGPAVRWQYFAGGGDSWSARANTVLGPNLPSAPRGKGHPPVYFLEESAVRFALPLLVGRWRDLYYCLEADSPEVAFADVLLGTAIGGPSWDVHWRLRPGETRTVRCRVTVGRWPGWEAIEEHYRAWPACPDRAFRVTPSSRGPRQAFTLPVRVDLRPDSGLALSQKLFETRGREVLRRVGLTDRCSVACLGGASQNAGLDDQWSRDHMWGPYLTFLLREEDWATAGSRLTKAVAEMPDEVDGFRWVGYDGPLPRATSVERIVPFLQRLTGLAVRPETDRDWLSHLTRESFLGRRWTEELFDAGQGAIFHDPGKQLTELWRHWRAYVPPEIHRTLLARALFRVWNAGPEYNLLRAHRRGDPAAFSLAASRFVGKLLELAFTWNEQFVPLAKWRLAYFRRLPICPRQVSEAIEPLCSGGPSEARLETAARVIASVKPLMKDLYHLPAPVAEPLCSFAHAMRATISDPEVKSAASLDW